MINSKDNSLEYSGIKSSKIIHWNLPVSELIEDSILAKQGELTHLVPLSVVLVNLPEGLRKTSIL